MRRHNEISRHGFWKGRGNLGDPRGGVAMGRSAQAPAAEWRVTVIDDVFFGSDRQSEIRADRVGLAT
jgi:hypothetical protein